MFKRIILLSFVVAALAGLIDITRPQAAAALPQTFAAATVTEEKCTGGDVHPVEWNKKVDKNSCCPPTYGQKPTSTQCFFAKYLNPTVNLLGVIFGIIIVASVIYGGIMISSSAGDSGKYAKGRQRIINSLLALAAFVFFYAFMQYIIPGGFGT